MNLVIPSTGSGIAQAILEALERSSLPASVTGADEGALAFGLYDCERRQVVPQITDPAYIPALLDLCRRSSARLLIPALDTELVEIASAAHLFREQGTEALVADTGLVELCRDKLRWAEVFGGALPKLVPAAWEVERARDALRRGELELPLIGKPRDGSASRGVRVVHDEASLEALPPGLIVQPFLLPHAGDANRDELLAAAREGRHLQLSELSLQYVFSKGGELIGQMATVNRLKYGVPTEIAPIDYEPLRETLAPLVELLIDRGARGPVNLQGRLTDDGPRFFESNPRFTGISGVRAMLGFNEVDCLIRDWLDLPRAAPLRVNMRRVGLRQVGMRLVDERRIAAVAGASASEARRSRERRQKPGSALGPVKTVNGYLPRTVAVSGASGWLGRHLVLALSKSGEHSSVRAFVRSDEKAETLRGWLGARDGFADVVAATGEPFGFGLSGTDLLINLAGARPTMSAAEIASSLTCQLNLLREAEALHVPSIINISSQSVYQPSGEEPCREDATVGPDGGYGMMKWAVEQAVERISRTNKAVRTTSLRLSRLYGMGDGMRWSEVPHAFAAKAARGEEIELRSRAQRYDLLHLRDAVAAIMFLTGRREDEWEGVYNVGGGGVVSLADLARVANVVASGLGLPGARVKEAWVGGEGTQCPVVLDSGRIRAAGWRPKVSLEEGIEELLREISPHGRVK